MQEMNGMISVIVPVYNGETYLTECIQSVQRQSYEHWELIAVDDGSTDGSAEILNAFAREDSRIRVIHCENGGVSRARNRAMEEARGEFLTFLDGDDCLVTDALKVMYSQIGTADILIAEMTRRRTNVRGGGVRPNCLLGSGDCHSALH